MSEQHQNTVSSDRPRVSAGRKLNFFRKAEAAMANPPAPTNKRRKSIIPRRGMKSFLPRAFMTYEERYQSLFILSNQKKFWSKVEKTDSCWLWKACCAAHGYGQFSSNEIHIGAHRYAFILANGPVDKGLHLHHRCETPACVNPDHIQALTPLEHKAAHAAMRAAHIAPAVHECFMEQARRTR